MNLAARQLATTSANTPQVVVVGSGKLHANVRLLGEMAEPSSDLRPSLLSRSFPAKV